ncbi:hypothetical protein [Dethiobacter alkaliphilus]|uniref:Uncharacterized protein n=1 Tax=Dethiobacter alkaliphilus AHT 1 TaxID=555088 RepID=C0GK08_DETAL|nr:hypothetical protein [Dethiobacter alkaliphilus]EEG76278.1 hypothetical protein DealDRAFT_2817 [Dethiobacter alkaliphilus AHT 1]
MKDGYVINDRLILAAFSGTVAAIAANLFLYLINLFLPGDTVNMPQLTLEIFLNIGAYTTLQIILGFVWSLVVGGTYAFIYILILDWTGWKNAWLKALIVVSGLWVFMAGFIMKLLNLAEATRNEPLSIAAFYIAHLFFALLMSYLVQKFGEPTSD